MTDLRSWLKRRPTPAKVRVDERVVAVPDTPRKWSDLENTINAMGWSKIEALDPEGQIIRVTADDDVTAEEEIEAAKAGRAGELAQLGHEMRECVRVVQQGQSDTWSKVVQAAYDLAAKLSVEMIRLERELAVARARIFDLEREAVEAPQQDIGSVLMASMAKGRADAKAATEQKPNGASKPAAPAEEG
jgi:hypothetical protein